MAMTKQDSVFQNISLSGGISTRATEFKELAATGDRWESPVFTMGSAKESTDIPQLPSLTRKPHRTAAGVLRGGNHPTSGQNAGSGYHPTMTSPGHKENGTSGFSNEVDQAFDSKANNTAGLPTTNGVPTSGTTPSYDGVPAR
jgi:hypothetical protein